MSEEKVDWGWAGRAVSVALRVLATGAVVLFMAVVLGIPALIAPRFEKIFAEFAAPLPSGTQSLLWFSHCCRDYALVVGFVLALSLAAAIFFIWKVRGRWAWVTLICIVAGAPVVMGTLVGWMVISLFLPLVSIIQAARAQGAGGGGP